MIYTLTLNPAVDRELTVPRIEFDCVLRSTEMRIDFGGKGFNVSRMLQSLGASSMALGFAGGKGGELLEDGLHSLGIETDFVWVVGETRTNVSIVSRAHDHYVKVNEPGPAITAQEKQELLEKVRLFAKPGDWWVLAGSLPPGLAADTYAEIIAILRAQGARAILDSSGEALRLGCRSCPYLVKPNTTEIHELTGLPVASPGEIAAACGAARKMGVEVVVVSLGKDGAMLVEDGQAWIACSPEIEERNPIGAGDALVGGIVWALQGGLPLKKALSWGVACGAATASLSGTAVGSRTLVEGLLEKVRVTPC